jgi:inorganic pyrophosphatase
MARVLVIRMGMPSLLRLPALGAEGVVHVVIESPRGATSKLKYDPALEAFTLSRPLPLGLAYPHDWGFVPGTRGPDGDPVDAMVLSEGTSYPGVVVRARPVALVALEQKASRGGRERNDRLIVVPEKAPRTEYRDADDLPGRLRQELEKFFLDVTHFQQKEVKILGWESAAKALAFVTAARV